MLDNQNDIEKYNILYRDFDLDSFPLQVFVGVRRSGKSFLLFQKMRMMLDAGYGWEDMLYLDFEPNETIYGAPVVNAYGAAVGFCTAKPASPYPDTSSVVPINIVYAVVNELLETT